MKTINGRDLILIRYPPIILGLTLCISCSLRPVGEPENIKRIFKCNISTNNRNILCTYILSK